MIYPETFDRLPDTLCILSLCSAACQHDLRGGVRPWSKKWNVSGGGNVVSIANLPTLFPCSGPSQSPGGFGRRRSSSPPCFSLSAGSAHFLAHLWNILARPVVRKLANLPTLFSSLRSSQDRRHLPEGETPISSSFFLYSDPTHSISGVIGYNARSRDGTAITAFSPSPQPSPAVGRGSRLCMITAYVSGFPFRIRSQIPKHLRWQPSSLQVGMPGGIVADSYLRLMTYDLRP